MKRELIFTEEHPDNNPKQKLIIKLSGGSPWYGYIWVNGVVYTVTEGARTVKIKKLRRK